MTGPPSPGTGEAWPECSGRPGPPCRSRRPAAGPTAPAPRVPGGGGRTRRGSRRRRHLDGAGPGPSAAASCPATTGAGSSASAAAGSGPSARTPPGPAADGPREPRTIGDSPRRWRRAAPQAQGAAEVHAVGLARDERVGPALQGVAVVVVGPDGAAEPVPRLQQRQRDRPSQQGRGRGQAVRGGQAGQPATDHDHVLAVRRSLGQRMVPRSISTDDRAVGVVWPQHRWARSPPDTGGQSILDTETRSRSIVGTALPKSFPEPTRRHDAIDRAAGRAPETDPTRTTGSRVVPAALSPGRGSQQARAGEGQAAAQRRSGIA